MKDLVKEVWKDFVELKENPKLKKVIVDTMPILYFGDYSAYQKSKIKIVTVSLNPSDAEFTENKEDTNYKYFRFPDAEGLRGKKILNDSDVDMYMSSLNKYFNSENVPYKEWFDDNRRELFDIFSASYYCEEKDTDQDCNFPLHIDMATPIATNPTWTNKLLSNVQKQIFMEKEKETWKKLVKILSPDIMLMSLDSKYIRKVDDELYEGLLKNEKSYREKGNKRRKRYLTYDYPCENGKIIKVMDIITANKAFQFTKGGEGHGEIIKILKMWKEELV